MIFSGLACWGPEQTNHPGCPTRVRNLLWPGDSCLVALGDGQLAGPASWHGEASQIGGSSSVIFDAYQLLSILKVIILSPPFFGLGLDF